MTLYRTTIRTDRKGEGGGDAPEVNDVVELSDGGVPDLGTCEAVLALDLRAKVAQEDDGGLIGAEEEGANEEVGGPKGGGVAAKKSR